MSSQFDDLLADIGDLNASTTASKTTSNGAGDDFDPFGPSDTPTSNGGGDSGLLLDFTADTEVQNSETRNGVDIQFQMESSNTSSSANPLYEMSSAESSNPLYEFSSANPLYDLTSTEDQLEEKQSSSANPLYDFETITTITTATDQPTNPLYDFESMDQQDASDHGVAQEEADLLSGTNQNDDLLFGTNQNDDLLSGTNQNDDLLSGTNQDDDDHLEVEQNTAGRVQSGQFDDLEYSLEHSRNGDQQERAADSPLDFSHNQYFEQPIDSEETALGSFTKEEVIVYEEEDIMQDGRTVSKTSKTENRYSDSGLESTRITSQEFTSSQLEDQGVGDRQTNEQDIVHFNEISSVKNKFESEEQTPATRCQLDIQKELMSSEGGVYESQPQAFEQWQNEEEEEGVYESQPVKRGDVAREADKDVTADLPAVGTAQNIRAKFMAQKTETTSRSKREITPPAHGSGGEYVSEPRAHMEKYEGKAEAGVFESQPQVNPDVMTSDTVLEEAVPERGFARNVAARFKEMEIKGSAPIPAGKREITPDRSGRVEFVSEPRSQVEHYEGQAESGVFESQPVENPDIVRSGQETEEQLPERGMAKNLAQRFRQISSDNTSPPSAGGRAKREITPDTSSRVEYVSEPRSHVETYQPKVDSGVFENQPVGDDSVVRADELTDDYVPERGFTRNVAAKFRELESNAKSPPLSPGRRKEFTPPRDESGRTSGVYESTPEVKGEVTHSGDQAEEALPERGTAKNMAQRFRQLEVENSSPQSSKPKKEFTPPPVDSGVFENQPAQFQADYNRPAESGIVENQPAVREDVVKGDEPPKYEEELPERGMARNLVSRWKQMESESAKAGSPGSTGRHKEFTPPREDPKIGQHSRSPRTPMSPQGQMDNGSVHPSELPGQYQPVAEPSVFESEPERRPDVYREEDTDWTDGMPKKDSAKKMLARFQKIQSQAMEQETSSPVTRRESQSESEPCAAAEPSKPPTPSVSSEPPMENARLKFEDPDQVGRSKSMRAAIQTEKCGACEKTVYAMERLEMNKRVYHKACFRCTKCKSVLTPKTFAINNDTIFCTTHYKQLFATKGNYDEGFGRMQHKKRWGSQPNLTDGNLMDAHCQETNGNS